MKLRGAIFDMDGTLLDSMPIWDTAASFFLRARGITPPEGVDTVFKSLSLQDAAAYLSREFGVSGSNEEIIGDINRMTEGLYEQVLPKPGVAAFLATLAAREIPMSVATMTDRYLVERTLGRTGLLGFFRGIVTCTEAGAGKDSPAVYERALALLGTARAGTVVFEDAYFAMKTAKAAGFSVAAVYDASTADVFEKSRALADYIVLSFQDISVEEL